MSRPSGKARKATSRRQKARHQLGKIQEHLQKATLILEVRDARAPRSTSCDRMIRFPRDKARALILTKTDLADPAATEAWLAWARSQKIAALGVDMNRPKQAQKRVVQFLEKHSPTAGMLRIQRVVVVGLPNVGKSTLINGILGRRAMRAGNRPGVTKGESWCKVRGNLYLLDTPGVIEAMTRLVQEDGQEDPTLALIRAAPESLLDPSEAVATLLERLGSGLEGAPVEARVENQPGQGRRALEALASAWNLVSKGGERDLHRAAVRVLKQVGEGSWGRLTLEGPEDEAAETDPKDAS